MQYAVRLAHQANCSLPENLLRDHEQIVDCLREAPLAALLRTDVRPPTFLSAFGPSVDGVVVKHDVMRQLLTAPLAGQERPPRDGFSVSTGLLSRTGLLLPKPQNNVVSRSSFDLWNFS